MIPIGPLSSLDPASALRFQAVEPLVGNTPLLRIDCTDRGRRRSVFAKYEQVNMTGSIKDRMALHILRRAYAEGRIRPGDPIAEATSGNTGISFSAIGRLLGHPVTIFMPDWMSTERMAIISGFGAAIVPVSRGQGGFLGGIRLSEELAAREPRTFLPCQFSNDANVDAHCRSTGPEIVTQLAHVGRRVDAFVAGVGTGGTVMGVGRHLRRAVPGARVHPIEPAESPTLSTGYKVGQHRIAGISDEFIPAIVDLTALDRVIAVHDGDAILMAQKLAHAGLAVGISSGANFVGALAAHDELGDDATVVTVFADSNKKYLSTDLMREERTRPEYLAPGVEITAIASIGRVCAACFDHVMPPA